MMHRIHSLRLLLALVVTVAGSAAARAQSHEEQAKKILELFESGQTDTAYALIEPLKKSARFVPAVIYVRAQMTQDDRALNLYKELIALDPTGEWADDAAYQLVRRYADKRDSVAAYIWLAALKGQHGQSAHIARADEYLRSVTSWQAIEGAAELASARRDSAAKNVAGKPTKDGTKPTTKPTDDKKGKDGKKTTDGGATETYSASGMRGYALQVGLFPSRTSAEARARELKTKNIRAVPLPKTVNGKKQYALVVGPYTSIEDATKKKPSVTTSCDCQAFIVKVE